MVANHAPEWRYRTLKQSRDFLQGVGTGFAQHKVVISSPCATSAAAECDRLGKESPAGLGW